MSKYTDADVQRLVESAGYCCRAWGGGLSIKATSAYHIDLKRALEPFLPDPEEELVEAMAEADWKVFNRLTPWDGGKDVIRQRYIEAAREVLAVVKEKGLPT